MKPKHRDRGEAQPSELDAREKQWRRYRAGLVALLDGVREIVESASPEFEFQRGSIRGLLMAAYYILDINTPFPLVEDAELVRRAVEELRRACGPLGLGLEHWDKIDAWQKRDALEGPDADSLVNDLP